MANSLLGALVNAQVAGATTGQMTGATVLSGQLLPGSGGAVTGGVVVTGGQSSLVGALVNAQAAGTQTGQVVGPVVQSALAASSGASLLSGSSAIQGPLGGSLSSAGTSGSGFSSFAAANGLFASQPSFVPPVGGVLFDRCADVMTDIGEITGAYWDEARGSLVLMGRKGKNDRPLPMRLPKMDKDLFVIALRAAIAGDSVGVSIDPPAKLKDHQELVQDGTVLHVSYMGATAGTLPGAIMFEADRLMKSLSGGMDNVSRNPLRANVPGYVPIIEMLSANEKHTGSWHRYWFVIDHVEIQLDPASHALLFKDVGVKVMSEVELGGPVCSTVDPNDKAFTEHLTKYYDQYAVQFPVLARLKELAKIVAVAKYLVYKNVPLDLEAIFSSPVQFVDTAKTTPAIKVLRTLSQTTYGNVTETRSVSLCGGVDFDLPAPRTVPDTDGAAKRLQTVCEKVRPSASALAWNVGSISGTDRARALSLGAASQPFRKMCEDYLMPAIPGFAIKRVYKPTYSSGDFGPGWRLWMPYSMTVWQVKGKCDEVATERDKANSVEPPTLILHDHTANQSSLYRVINRGQTGTAVTFAKITSQNAPSAQTGSRGSFSYDPAATIVKDGEYYLLRSGSAQYRFTEKGLLVRVDVESGKTQIVYEYQKDQLMAISDQGGRRFQLRRSSAGRIDSIQTPDGKAVTYDFDDNGRLNAVRIDTDVKQAYGYDMDNRLSEIREGNGGVVSRMVYDEAGQTVVDGTSLSVIPSYEPIRRQVLNARVVTVQDHAGGVATYQYRADGTLSAVVVSDRQRMQWKLQYDPTGHLAMFQAANGAHMKFGYESGSGLLTSVECVGGIREFKRDTKKRVTAVSADGAEHSRVEYGRFSGVTVQGSGKAKWKCRYAHNGISIQSESEALRFRRRPQVTSLICRVGLWRAYGVQFSRSETLGSMLRPLLSLIPGAQRVLTFITQNEQGDTSNIFTNAGKVALACDAKKLQVSVAFGG